MHCIALVVVSLENQVEITPDQLKDIEKVNRRLSQLLEHVHLKNEARLLRIWQTVHYTTCIAAGELEDAEKWYFYMKQSK